MLPTTVLSDERPRCVVRPRDMKALQRFLRNAKPYLLAGGKDGAVTFREADAAETAKWRDALALYRAWGGEEDAFFGLPL